MNQVYKFLTFITLITVITVPSSFAQTTPTLRYADKIRIKEAIHISDQFGEQLFKGYTRPPFAIILVTDSIEFLIYHPYPSADFILIGMDTLLKTKLYYRKRKYPIDFLASFPAVNGLTCIVAGIPENTRKNSSEWIVTLLHEHFHQYQYGYPDYQQSVQQLDLSGGDQTGMWMLNYPFPYDSTPVKKQYGLFINALYKTIASSDTKAFNANLAQYLIERKKMKAVLPEADYRYFSFQIWQEGLARNTEYRFIEMLANHYTPSKEVLALADFMPFADLKTKMYKDETSGLVENKLDEVKRVCFYSIGFAEGMILDRINTSWRNNYLTDKFYIEHYFRNIPH